MDILNSKGYKKLIINFSFVASNLIIISLKDKPDDMMCEDLNISNYGSNQRMDHSCIGKSFF